MNERRGPHTRAPEGAGSSDRDDALGAVLRTLCSEGAPGRLSALVARQRGLAALASPGRAERLEADRLDTALGLLVGDAGLLSRAETLLRIDRGLGAIALAARAAAGSAEAALAAHREARRLARLAVAELGRGAPIPLDAAGTLRAGLARLATLTADHAAAAASLGSLRTRIGLGGSAHHTVVVLHAGRLRAHLLEAMARGPRPPAGHDEIARAEATLDGVVSPIVSGAPLSRRAAALCELYGLAVAGAALELGPSIRADLDAIAGITRETLDAEAT